MLTLAFCIEYKPPPLLETSVLDLLPNRPNMLLGLFFILKSFGACVPLKLSRDATVRTSLLISDDLRSMGDGGDAAAADRESVDVDG